VRAFFKYWLPVLLWMVLIFTASSDTHSYEHSSRLVEPILRWLFPHWPPARLDEAHEFCRKCAHVTEYAIFAVLVRRALCGGGFASPGWSWSKVGGTLLLVFSYASTDEFHQRFVPTRTSSVRDVFLDTAGGALGLFVLWFVGRIRKRPNQKMP